MKQTATPAAHEKAALLRLRGDAELRARIDSFGKFLLIVFPVAEEENVTPFKQFDILGAIEPQAGITVYDTAVLPPQDSGQSLYLHRQTTRTYETKETIRDTTSLLEGTYAQVSCPNPTATILGRATWTPENGTELSIATGPVRSKVELNDLIILTNKVLVAAGVSTYAYAPGAGE